MATQKKSTEDRRNEITEAVLGIVQEHGQKGLSIAAVARRIGLVPSAIYRHYRNKDAMIEGVLDFVARRLADNLATEEGTCSSQTERLHNALERHLVMVRQNRGLLRIVFSDDVFGGTERRRTLLGGIVQRYLRAVADIVAAGQKSGEFREDIDPSATAALFLGLVQPLAVLWHLSDGKTDITRMAEKNWKVFLRGIESAGTSGTEGTY
ncbi:MAG: hypothetical protein PWP23_1632 [Candidatus Sumerlaeota bacterium]|nr:hypothetical protein [Candidatus Sumerlaeota bacterium]